MAWKQARWNPLRRFVPNGRAITVDGRNRYTSQPVNDCGLTREADELLEAFLAAFPESPTKRNFAVDRMMRGSTTSLSDHARGEALDIMVSKFDGEAGVSAADRAWGDRVFEWFKAQMVGPTATGLRGKQHQGPFRIAHVIWDGEIVEAGRSVRALKPGDPHRSAPAGARRAHRQCHVPRVGVTDERADVGAGASPDPRVFGVDPLDTWRAGPAGLVA